jgi:alkaline phosphatase D
LFIEFAAMNPEHASFHGALMTTRRTFIRTSAAALITTPLAAAATQPPHQATGARVGEVTDSTAIVWTRLTKHATRNNEGVVFAMEKGKQAKKKPKQAVPPVHEIEGACPCMAGRIRLRYSLREDMSEATELPWADVSEASDGIHSFKLTGLKPGSTYHYLTDTMDADGSVHDGLKGKFHSAPDPKAASALRFCVMTCQGYQDRDHADGHPIYPSMMALDPRFIVMTGDLVYYDSNPPVATSAALARLHWQRMFSLPRLVDAMRSTSTYWLKDDHDTLTNDSWPGMKAGELTFAEGQRIFHEQVPMGEQSYRTIRWGRDLQIWFTDGRDHRSANEMEDGPEKTIWGAEQKAWFKQTVKESDATWKVLISPTPLVGPDRGNKNDNHSNEGFTYEGDELRAWLKANVPDNFFVVCGDRHWQYHSVHPTTGVQEFSVGAASDSHASGSPGEDKTYHKYHLVKGGFLSVELTPGDGVSSISFQLRHVDGALGYEAKYQRKLG